MLECIESLRRFETSTETLLQLYDALPIESRSLGYTGNPLAPEFVHKAAEVLAGWKQLIGRPEFAIPAWQELIAALEKGNVFGLWLLERDYVHAVLGLVKPLLKVIEACRDIATQDPLAFVVAVEHNIIPLRQRFEPLFSAWIWLSAIFDLSTMITTELFYWNEGLGSLSENPPLPDVEEVVARAGDLARLVYGSPANVYAPQ